MDRSLLMVSRVPFYYGCTSLRYAKVFKREQTLFGPPGAHVYSVFEAFASLCSLSLCIHSPYCGPIAGLF